MEYGIRANVDKFFSSCIEKTQMSCCCKKLIAQKISRKFGNRNGVGRLSFPMVNQTQGGWQFCSKKNLNYIVHDISTDDNGRILCMDIEFDGHRFILCNIYAPNDDQPEFFKKCAEVIEKCDNVSKVTAGDFNLVMDIDLDKKGGRPVTNFNAREVLETYMGQADLIDIWRVHHPTDKIYTWKRLGKAPIFCRLDMFLISQDLYSNIIKTDIIPSFKSDHSIISMNLDFTSQSRGRGFWKLNASLFKDKEYVEIINKTIDDSVISYENHTPTLRLEMIKMEVAGASIKYSRQKAKSKHNIINALEKKLKRLERNVMEETDNYKIDRLKKDIDSTNFGIQNYMFEKTKASMFRARVKWYEEGEKSSKYFSIWKRQIIVKRL